MPKKPTRKRPTDMNQMAASIVAEVTGSAKADPEKNPAAVALGRMGGKKGGPARAKALSAAKRSEIAKKAALARWGDQTE